MESKSNPEKLTEGHSPDNIDSSSSSRNGVSADDKPTVLTEENVEKVHNDINYGYDPRLAPTYTEAEENAVIRKLDWHLLPLIFVLYSLSVLDRSNLGNARISGMEDDIDLSGTRYDWLGTTFYIACEYFEYGTCRVADSFARRYSIPMDPNWLESFQAPSMGSRCCLSLGIRLDYSSGLQ